MSIWHVYYASGAREKTYPLKRVSFCLVSSSALVHLANFQLSYHKFYIDFHFNTADKRLRRHLSQDEMYMGIGMLHSGLSQRHVANVLGVSQSVVSRMWNRFITTGNVRGRERSTNEVQDQFLVVQARRHRFDNATTLRRDFRNATGVRISTQTIRNWLHDAGLRSRRPAIRVPLT